MIRPTCPWCGSRFTPRTSGGKPQRFLLPEPLTVHCVHGAIVYFAYPENGGFCRVLSVLDHSRVDLVRNDVRDYAPSA